MFVKNMIGIRNIKEGAKALYPFQIEFDTCPEFLEALHRHRTTSIAASVVDEDTTFFSPVSPCFCWV
jgi:hypothetical protein